MKWEVVAARNGEQTLLLNDVLIYSKYRPREDASRWVESEIDVTKESFLLIGLGLGYHAEKIAELIGDKMVYVYYFDEIEKQYYQPKYSNIQIVNTLQNVVLNDKTQILIPNVWVKAIGERHPLLPYLEDIKINQITYRKNSELMEKNFMENMRLQDTNSYPNYSKKTACLISSGPSLDETIQWLTSSNGDFDIFVVGSALKMVLAHNIVPSAVVISDPKSNIRKQLENVDYIGSLFYLSTANYETVKVYNGARYILFQQGYPEAEKASVELNFPLIETGGSVATTAFSLIEQLGFENVVLFGQDLGFSSKRTHAILSTSGINTSSNYQYKKVISNEGNEIYTTANLNTYLRWFNTKLERTPLKVYNTALQGAKINNVPYINKQQFQQLISEKNL